MLSVDVGLVERAVALKDGRLLGRVLRDVSRVRRAIHPTSLQPAGNTATLPATNQRSFTLPTLPTLPTLQTATLQHLAALFAVIQSLEHSATPPHSLSHIRDTQLTRDDTAQQAWKEAQDRREQQRQKEETERKETADRETGQQHGRRAADDSQAMQLDDDGKQQPHSEGTVQQPQGTTLTVHYLARPSRLRKMD